MGAESSAPRSTADTASDRAQETQAGFRTPMNFSADWGQTWTYQSSPFPAISSVQRQVLMRLGEGPLLFCSYTDQWRDWKKRKARTVFTMLVIMAIVTTLMTAPILDWLRVSTLPNKDGSGSQIDHSVHASW